MFWLGLSSWVQSGNCDDVNYLDRSHGFKFLASTAFGCLGLLLHDQGFEKKRHITWGIYLKVIINFSDLYCSVHNNFEKPSQAKGIFVHEIRTNNADIFLMCIGIILDICFITWWVLIICSTLHFQDGTLNPYEPHNPWTKIEVCLLSNSPKFESRCQQSFVDGHS